MSNKDKLFEFLRGVSFREFTLAVDFFISGCILYFYVKSLYYGTAEQLESATWLSGLLLEVIIYSIVLSIVSYLSLTFISDDELSKPLDVREKQISLVGYKYSAIILQVGVVMAIFQYNMAAQSIEGVRDLMPHLPLHVMVVAFLLAELANYGAQIVKGRSGEIYE
ncbi:hypothetical protein Sden_1424 [Shewanella denitrificans OS217]|jgi:hypothetical protein|uniref:Uncharacterized protein n=1 Tax=Shewanella denitrificans (strain OS217 / ATCC BAA-1090 / DSM 15013) TaxID=318161 RepID=Q12PB6_SHEDO|nr:hypothetical protein [Shewanella denitrificans]ABE54710.1 hypothetical protein Sden_1424 [Shewanella denitrificans OS217]